jgi:uncharacterized repeat protein (TIGR01451 family)
MNKIANNQKRRLYMKYAKITRLMAALLALALAAPLAAQAAGTASGTSITNTATVVYTVASITQPMVSSGPTGTFVVDTKVNLTVQRVDASYVSTGPSSTQYLTFRVVNNGNLVEDYALQAISAGIADPFGGADNFDATAVQVFVDSNGDGIYTAATDTFTFIDGLATDATATVFIVGNIPVVQVTGDIAAYALLATTHDAGAAGALGALTVETVGAGTLLAVDVVFADAANANVAADTNRDGEASDRGAYRVVAAAITIVKSVATYSDPFNGTTNPKAIPGAVMTYTITVSNAAGGANATNVTVSDNLTGMPATFAAQFGDATDTCGGGQGIVVDADGPGGAAGVCNSNAADADNGSFAANTVTVSGLTINAGTSATVKFQVIVN